MNALDYVKQFNGFLWNDFLMYVLLAVGIFYTIYLGFPQIRHFGLMFKYAFGPAFKRRKKRDKHAKQDEAHKVNSFQALATAVAAQVGTGNIGGVATAIATGGVGAIFWMWVSSLLGMGTIFSEATLAQKYREVKDGGVAGGPAYYISKGLKCHPLAVFFALAIILALGCVGNMVQANSISIAIVNSLGTGPDTMAYLPYLIGVALALLVGVVIMGGQKRITAIAELVVPFMALIYILGSLVVLFLYIGDVPHMFQSVVSEAFSTKAAAGGAAGTVMKYAIRYGVARGLFSNEAGMGSTPHAHAMAHVKDPAIQGFVAMAGVFVDTILICSSTAFVIMLTGAYQGTDLKSVAITQEAFSRAFGSGGVAFLAIALFFFAFTTIMGWYMFGEMNVRYLFGKYGVLPFRLIVCGCIFCGCIFAADLVWELADTFNGLMAIPNLIAIVWLAPQVRKMYTHFLQRRRSGEF